MTLDEHVATLFGDLLLKLAKQAAANDALREQLAAEQAQPTPTADPPAEPPG